MVGERSWTSSARRLAQLILCVPAATAILSAGGPRAAGAVAKPTLAVLPFVGATRKENTRARRMRFAIDRKLARQHMFKRVSWEHIANVLSAMPFTWKSGVTPANISKAVKYIGAQESVMGFVVHRKLTVEVFHGTKIFRKVTGIIPPGNISPRLALEHLLTALVKAKFKHIRTWQIDRRNPVLTKLFQTRPNLVRDGQFQKVTAGRRDNAWQVVLMKQLYAPRLVTSRNARTLAKDRACIAPQSVVAGGYGAAENGRCLEMRIGVNVAQSNGLACESTWIPVKSGDRYRFLVQYHSNAPRVRIFLKGFSYMPDKFSNAHNLASARQEMFRAQVKPVTKNTGWKTTGMDFTPLALHPHKFPIQWIRIDFFVYLNPGTAYFRNIVIKNITP